MQNSKIISDSLSALQAIRAGSWKKHSITNKISLLSSTLHSAGYYIVFMCVPGYTGIPGNEIADILAKSASSKNPQPDDNIHRKSNTLLWIHQMLVTSLQTIV